MLCRVLLHLANQSAKTMRGVVVICWKANLAFDKPASHSSCVLIGQSKRKPPESCQKRATQLSQTNKKKLRPSRNGTKHCTVNEILPM